MKKKNIIRTSENDATKAAEELRKSKNKNIKSISASDLENRKQYTKPIKKAAKPKRKGN